MALETAVRRVQDLDSLFDLLRDELEWPLDPSATVDDSTFEWTAEELHVSDRNAERLSGGVVRQLRPFTETQPWGIFLLEFADGRVYRTALRDVLRRLVPSRRRDPTLPSWRHDNLLFISATRNYDALSFTQFRGEEAKRAVLTTFGWDKGDTHIRTLCEFNLDRLRLPGDMRDEEAWLSHWRSAFDVRRVSDDFFKNYKACFDGQVRPAAQKMLGDRDEAHNYTQLLLNRLMFCWFLQKKGWLGGRQDYLLHLLNRACSYTPQRNLLRDYLDFLFLEVLANPEDERRKREPSDPHIVWEAPFLNGGLFERTPLDDKAREAPRLKRMPNTVFQSVLQDLFARYNFTVEESTSLDLQVALDPELLGTIFERLVTGRHETGSYYTPKPIVEFMCREALAHYLASAVPSGWRHRRSQIEEFVHDHSAGGISPADAPDIIRGLDEVRVCDPACGSGAYLVTMLHELVSLYRLMYSEKLRDPKKDYDLKLRIIQRNLYGVDIDQFAINIARLRLWLSLVVENEETDWRRVEPLPNLEFKIERGDSLTASLGQQQALQHGLIAKFKEKKADYMVAHDERKTALRREIDELRREMASWLHADGRAEGFDWGVEFAEVFEPKVSPVTIGGALNLGYELAEQPRPGGFDIVITNPPYLRQEVVKRQFGDQYKANLVRLYPDSVVKTADIYVAFYARAHELLRAGAVGCFISSNKWLRAAYGEKLRRRLLDEQAFHLVVDFGELPVFEAATFPAIFLWEKQPRGGAATTWAVVKGLEACYGEGLRAHIARIAQALPGSQFGKDKPRLTSPETADRLKKMEQAAVPLGEYVKGRVHYGIKTGFNTAFVIDAAKREELIAQNPKSAEIIKPLVVGDDVRKWRINRRDRWLIVTRIGVNMERYPAVFTHLRQWQPKLEARWDKGEHWWELRACDYYDALNKPKIVYPDIAMEPRFTLDSQGCYIDTTAFAIPEADLFLLAVLNSDPAWGYLAERAAVLGDTRKRGRLRLKRQYLEKLPIPAASDPDRTAISLLVQKCLDAEGVGCEEWEREIDERVAGLYGL